MNAMIKKTALLVLVAAAALAPQAAQAHHHHDWRENCHATYNNAYYNPGYYVQPSYVNTYLGPDGYPAWMGGYRPYRR